MRKYFPLVFRICLIAYFLWTGFDTVTSIKAIPDPELKKCLNNMFWFIMAVFLISTNQKE